MLFSLRNIRATYQWLVNKIFRDRIDHNMEVYVNDLLFKSHASRSHVEDFKKTFATLHWYQMKLKE